MHRHCWLLTDPGQGHTIDTFRRALLRKASFHGETFALIQCVSEVLIVLGPDRKEGAHLTHPLGCTGTFTPQPSSPAMALTQRPTLPAVPAKWVKPKGPTSHQIPLPPNTIQCLAMPRALIHARVSAQEQSRATPPQEFPQCSAGSSQAPC